MTVRTVVDAEGRPDLVAKLMDGTLCETTCPACGAAVAVDHALAYVDHPRRACCLCEPAGDIAAPAAAAETRPGYRLRRVRDANTLRELALVWREGLDDLAMLLVRHWLADRLARDEGRPPLLCAYDGREEAGEGRLVYTVFMTERDPPATATVPMEAYRTMTDLANRVRGEVCPDGEWVGWDAETARRAWERIEGGIAPAVR